MSVEWGQLKSWSNHLSSSLSLLWISWDWIAISWVRSITWGSAWNHHRCLLDQSTRLDLHVLLFDPLLCLGSLQLIRKLSLSFLQLQKRSQNYCHLIIVSVFKSKVKRFDIFVNMKSYQPSCDDHHYLCLNLNIIGSLLQLKISFCLCYLCVVEQPGQRGVKITNPTNHVADKDADRPPGGHPLLLSNCLLDLGIPSSLSLAFDYIVIGMFLLCCKKATFCCDPLKRGWFVIFPSPILASLFTSAVLAIPSAWMFDKNPKSQVVKKKNFTIPILYSHGHLEVALLVPDVLQCVRDHRDPHVHQVAARHLHCGHDCVDCDFCPFLQFDNIFGSPQKLVWRTFSCLCRSPIW